MNAADRLSVVRTDFSARVREEQAAKQAKRDLLKTEATAEAARLDKMAKEAAQRHRDAQDEARRLSRVSCYLLPITFNRHRVHLLNMCNNDSLLSGDEAAEGKRATAQGAVGPEQAGTYGAAKGAGLGAAGYCPACV